MPRSTVILSQQSEKAVFSDFSIVGQFCEVDKEFVRHVALLDGDKELPNEVLVYHMGPPLVSDPADESFDDEDRFLEPDLVVSLDLNEEKLSKIARWASRIAAEAAPRNRKCYTILPPVRPPVEIAENGQVKFHRFSCSGYVSEALRQVEILLCEEVGLPEIELKLLLLVYPELQELMERKATRQRRYLGIESDPPWPVLLPGYIFHGADHFLEHKSPVQPIIEMAYYRAT